MRFDGLRLMNPFHLKDFQSIFSAINPALVGAVDIYTGGFPVSFGDRMSGVIDIHPVRADAVARREIAVSLYNASALAAGRFDRGRGDWVISARRGNLDRVLEWSGMHLGEPTYSDIYAHVGHRIGDSMSVSANLLRFDDDIELADSDLEEQARRPLSRSLSVAAARCSSARIAHRIDAALHAPTCESVRRGEAEQPGISRGSLEDRREFTIQSLQTDWSWRAPTPRSCSSAENGGTAKADIDIGTRPSSTCCSTIPGALAEAQPRARHRLIAPAANNTAPMHRVRTEVSAAAHARRGCAGIARRWVTTMDTGARARALCID